MATSTASCVILLCLAIRASNDVMVFYNVYVALVSDGTRADIVDAYDTVIRTEYELEFPPAMWITLEIMKLASRSHIFCIVWERYIGVSKSRSLGPIPKPCALLCRLE